LNLSELAVHGGDLDWVQWMSPVVKRLSPLLPQIAHDLGEDRQYP
jgi:hypothetical protein